MSKSNLLIDEPPIVFQPTLAKLIGLHEAIVLQTLRYWCGNKKSGKIVDNERWIFNTLEQWREFSFPFWCARTIGEIFRTLESMGLVKSKQFDLQSGKAMKYYTITDAALTILTSERADHLEESSTPIWKNLPDHVEESSRSARTRLIKQYTEKHTEKQLTPTPCKGDEENSAEASHSSTHELPLTDVINGAGAQAGKANALDSLPPNAANARASRNPRKSPPMERPSDVSEENWLAFCDLRKIKRAPVTVNALNLLRKEAGKAGWSLDDAINECVLRNWQGFKAEWLKKEKSKTVTPHLPNGEIDWANVKPRD